VPNQNSDSLLGVFANAPYITKALIYAYDVIHERKPACKQEKQASQRFVDDLGRTGDDWPWFFDVAKAEDPCEFIEKLPHTKGRWARGQNTITLEGWQCFIIVNVFGFVDEHGLRRFRDVYAKIPRKNGKSLLAAAVALYMFLKDDEFGAEVYSGATTEKQAWEVFKPAKLMCQRAPGLQEQFDIDINAKNMAILSDASKFEPLIGNPGDGSSPSCAIVDEYHEHVSNDLVDTMETGMGAREHPLMLKITTAGSTQGGPCHTAELEYCDILSGIFRDDRAFIIIFGVDPEDDWTTEEALIKANPNIDVSVSKEFLRNEQAKAIRSPLRQNTFRRKHLNIWVGAAAAFLNLEDFMKCADPTLKIEDFDQHECSYVIDLASKIDIICTLRLFHEYRNGELHYIAFPKFYLPEEAVFSENTGKYESWVNAGYLETVDGSELDIGEFQQTIEDDLSGYMVGELVYDPWRAVQLAQYFEKQGIQTVEFRQNKQNFSPAMYELEAAITSNRLHYSPNPVLEWMCGNLVAKADAYDLLVPVKQLVTSKIDGAVALLMGIGRLMFKEDSGLDDYLNSVNK